MSLRCLCALVGGILFTGCAAPPESSDDVDAVAADAIQGGYTDATDTAVVGIYNLSQGGICTGSLLAPNMVLTARHCVSNTLNEAPGGGVVCSQKTAGNPFQGSRFSVNTDPSMSPSGEWTQGQEVVVLPTDNKFCGNDQAIIILSENVPSTSAVPMVPRVDSPLTKGEVYNAIGFGSTNGSGSGAGTRRRRDNLVVECAEAECSDFAAYVKSTEWIGETGICSGDSGGPAIDLQNRVVGVTSRGGANCSSPIYGSVHSWGDWIKQTALYAAQLGGYEPAPWASGWPTDPLYNLPIGESCDSGCGLCYDGVCTRYCSDELAPCPEGYACAVIESGQQVCAVEPEPASDPDPADGDDDDGGGNDETGGGCSSSGREDPTNPVPWLIGALGLVALRRRRGR